MSVHSAQISAGITPARISRPNTWQPTQNANTDSSVAAATSRTSRAVTTPSAPTASATTAAVVIVAPSACANRLGGPETVFGGPSRGAITPLASAPSGDSLGPVTTRAQKPKASGDTSQCA